MKWKKDDAWVHLSTDAGSSLAGRSSQEQWHRKKDTRLGSAETPGLATGKRGPGAWHREEPKKEANGMNILVAQQAWASRLRELAGAAN